MSSEEVDARLWQDMKDLWHRRLSTIGRPLEFDIDAFRKWINGRLAKGDE
jgi:hypothetical protein